MIFFILGLYPVISLAQYNSSFGFNAGVGNYLGEIGGTTEPARGFIYDLKLSQTKWAVGTFFRYKFTPIISASAHFNYQRVSGADRLSEYFPRKVRNLSFKNDLFELSSRIEIYFFSINDIGKAGRYVMDFKAYGFLGVGLFMSNPKASLDGDWHALRPLKTEGEKYALFNLSIPQGIGFFYTYRRKHRFGWELNWRTTFTDYIDDISTVFLGDAYFEDGSLSQALFSRVRELDNFEQEFPGKNKDHWIGNVAAASSSQTGPIRGDPTDNDFFMSMTLNYSFVFRGKSSFYKSKYSSVFHTGKGKKRKVRAKF
ncbi:MAG: hypothetical protein IH948_04480 [Bacteroidetes bacterium]|nr:hypothetical protein [Bacteroidota bacterium]